ncbi:YciI family protein [Cognatilysobacter lacus]|uniref:Transcription initiation protein n=1 Tax=Cognatilysobacter lacus TaxID=1643323 RepID=A0A5D8Z4N6_9GAMM|nr:YciI family protein [Lysobacter lacus]TZF89627.1 transcription initiation protein [Lysobacter lacus]
MAKYLISFPAAAMQIPDGQRDTVIRESHAVIDDAKAAGVYVFAGGLDDRVPVVRVAADGTTTEGGYPDGPALDGGFAVLELPTREAALDWAARLARACSCAQELRVFHFDPAS